ncbi:hypothetical protein [Streptosporangium jomthongense]|uniref:TerD domain-containing protein n=1 Tax=Streptosporangium jomthongense TaxID=1193683 RepID=A0ABV8F4D8_9ACTN
MDNLESLVITRRLRVPVDTPHEAAPGWGEVAARQLDAALLSVGFTCSAALLERLSSLPGEEVVDLGARVVSVVRGLVGDHVQHNAYFVDFPRNVPDTLEFWAGMLHEALLDPVAADRLRGPALNLLELPDYGRYQHTYADLLAAHAELVPLAGDRVTVLDLGGSLRDEARELYFSLAGSEVPPAVEDLAALRALAAFCVASGTGHPERVPVRENRAVLNEVRLAAGLPLLVDTVTDVLRLACGLSGGDVTLAVPTRFRSFRRAERRALLRALDAVATPAGLGDVSRLRERWKRLGERLHPHEHPGFPRAARVFEVARGDLRVAGTGSRVEAALAAGRTAEAVELLENAPGALLRRLDHLLRTGSDERAVFEAVERAVTGASGRVLLSLREHMQNRLVPAAGRVFVNRHARAWTAPDLRPPLAGEVLTRVLAVLDAEIVRRLPDPGELVVDPDALDVALPLSAKAVSPGLGMLPRGSLSAVDGELLRFFVHWREARRRTDYDLSALMLDASYGSPEHVSWTNLANGFARYSGDLTEAPAPHGASEFIDIRLAESTRPIVIPQVNVFSGESFDEAAEAFFGYMTRDAAQEGMPFEPRTVRMKSDLRGSGQIALPLVFLRGDDGHWRVKWLHLYLRGYPQFNRVEDNRLTASLLVRSIVERDYLRVRHLVELWRAKGPSTGRHVTYIGFEASAAPPGARVHTPATLHEVIPA